MENATKTINIIGQWASTIAILRSIGIRGLRNSEYAFSRIFIPSVFSFDRQTIRRCAEFPSGTHRTVLCHSIFLRIEKHCLYNSLPDLKIIQENKENFKAIQQEPARYHISSLYLTGEEKIYYDDGKAPIGVLGSFGRNVLQESIIAKSPYIILWGTPAYTSHYSYDEDFEIACRRYFLAKGSGITRHKSTKIYMANFERKKE
ncbi:hypothetical protein MXB_1259 [Myxobolus squamalis]|nr:hypothetical protein MXB_1259 [Myxobolus squamalis]